MSKIIIDEQTNFQFSEIYPVLAVGEGAQAGPVFVRKGGLKHGVSYWGYQIFHAMHMITNSIQPTKATHQATRSQAFRLKFLSKTIPINRPKILILKNSSKYKLRDIFTSQESADM